jgi:hypothetical protein
MNAQLIGSLLSLLTAILLALGMNVQRYSLTPSSVGEDGKIPVLCCSMKKNSLWLLGLMIYGSSNVPYMMGLSFAPLSLMTAVFASVLVFNVVFSNWITKEQLTKAKLKGCAVIVVGVALCGASAPSSMDILTADKVASLLLKPGAVIYILVLLALQLVMTIAVVRFDRQFPSYWDYKKDTLDLRNEDNRLSVMKVGTHGDQLRDEIQKKLKARKERVRRMSISGSKKPTSLQATSMLFCHTGVLAIFESLVQLWLKSLSSLGWRILDGEDDYKHWVFWFSIGAMCFCAVGVVWWLRKVYSRFEVTEGLPIEYGAVTMFGLIGGLTFYEESKELDVTSTIMLMCGLAIIIVGIFVPSWKQARPQLRTRLRTESMSPRTGAEMLGKKTWLGPELPEVTEEGDVSAEAAAGVATTAAAADGGGGHTLDEPMTPTPTGTAMVPAVHADASRIV